MALRERLLEWAQGNSLGRFWARFYRRQRVKNPLLRDLYTLLLLSGARRHGGYVLCGRDGDHRHQHRHGRLHRRRRTRDRRGKSFLDE